MSVDISYLFEGFSFLLALCKLQDGALSLDGPFRWTILCSHTLLLQRVAGLTHCFPRLQAFPELAACGKPASLVAHGPEGPGECIYLCLIPRESFGHLGVLERSLPWGSG